MGRRPRKQDAARIEVGEEISSLRKQRDFLAGMLEDAKKTIAGGGKQAMSARARISGWCAELRQTNMAIWKLEKHDQSKPVRKVEVVVTGGMSDEDRNEILGALGKIGCTPGRTQHGPSGAPVQGSVKQGDVTA